MDFTALLDGISRVGLPIVVSAVAIIVVRHLINDVRKMFNKMFDQLMTGVSHPPSKEHTQEMLEKAEHLDIFIAGVLESTLYSADAARAFLIKYHNGGHDMMGVPFRKMSITNEKVRRGVESFQTHFKDQFQTSFEYPVNEINQNDEFHFEDYEELQKNDPSLYNFSKSRGVIRSHLVSIRSAAGKAVGCICVEYEIARTISVESVRKILNDSKARIESALEFDGQIETASE